MERVEHERGGVVNWTHPRQTQRNFFLAGKATRENTLENVEEGGMEKYDLKIIGYLSDFLAHRKGLLPIIGIFLIICNLPCSLSLQEIYSTTDLLLHLGLIIAIFT